ncbi:hypothetical protein LguiB_013172 [Lonicera macranthoides]
MLGKAYFCVYFGVFRFQEILYLIQYWNFPWTKRIQESGSLHVIKEHPREKVSMSM